MSRTPTPRLHPRVSAAIDVHWWPAGSLTRRASTTADVSECGACILTSAPLPIDTPVELHLSTNAVAAPARVMWSDARRGRMGVRFVAAE